MEYLIIIILIIALAYCIFKLICKNKLIDIMQNELAEAAVEMTVAKSKAAFNLMKLDDKFDEFWNCFSGINVKDIKKNENGTWDVKCVANEEITKEYDIKIN